MKFRVSGRFWGQGLGFRVVVQVLGFRTWDEVIFLALLKIRWGLDSGFQVQVCGIEVESLRCRDESRSIGVELLRLQKEVRFYPW